MKKNRATRAKIRDGQVRCPRCDSLLCKIYYGGYAMGVETKCRCGLLVTIEAAAYKNRQKAL